MIQDIEEESKTKFSMDVEFSFSFKGIIKGLRNLIAIPDKNGYHSIVNGHR